MNTLRNWSPYRLAQLLPTYYPEGDVEINGETYPIGTPRWNIMNSPVQAKNNEDIRLFGKAIFNPMEGLLTMLNILSTELITTRMNTRKQ